ncbi:MAG TPA: hypothetical protein EYQ60_00105 [Myxococcales bacterium]|nr:hypothetical protein [Myxococcales bacterium]
MGRSRIVLGFHVAAALAALVWLAGWHGLYEIAPFGGDSSVFLQLGFGLYFASFLILGSILTPAFKLEALSRPRGVALFLVSTAVVVAFNLWSSFQLYVLQRDGL